MGLNETLTFFADSDGKLTSFAYEVIDFQELASKVKSARKRRLMTTPEWEKITTHANVVQPVEGPHPQFANTSKKYTSMGTVKKEVPVDSSGKQVAPQ